MAGLVFQFQEISDELEGFHLLSQEFIAPEARFVIPQFKEALDGYREQPTTDKYYWQISSENPLRTVVSCGDYEVGGHGALNVFAEIDACWCIRRMSEKKKSMPARQFRLEGIASTRVRLWREASNQAPQKEIAMWRMEVGDDASPGCHFHVQILGELAGEPFPKSLSIPRLPGLFLTPAAVVEFVLAELFQEAWAQHVGRDSPHLKRWAPIQARRFKRLLEWKLGILGEDGGSPWTMIKRQKPNSTLFVA